MKDGRLGDMPADEFEEYGRRAVAWVAEYLAHPERYPVLAQVSPGAIRDALPRTPPRTRGTGAAPWTAWRS